MSRHIGKGVNPKNGKPVTIAFGFDYVPGFKAGHFVQVYSNEEEDIMDDPSGEGLIVNEGFLDGLSIERRDKILDEYQLDWEDL